MALKDKLAEYSTLYLKSRTDVTDKTLQHISHVINNFIDWIPINKDIIVFDDYQQWTDTLNISTGTKAGYQCSLRDFIDFLNLQGLSLPRPIVIKTRDNYNPYLFTDDDYGRIIGIIDNYVYTNFRSLSEKHVMSMAVRVMFSTGLRVNEIGNLRLGDYDKENKLFHIKIAKNKKERLVPFHESLAEILDKYITKMGINNSSYYLFPLKDRTKHIGKIQVNGLLTIVLKQCGFERPATKYQRGICPHCFRHTFAVRSFRKSIDNGKDITDIVPYLSIYMGHHSLSETEKYLKFSTDLFPESVEKFDEYSSDLFEEN